MNPKTLLRRLIASGTMVIISFAPNIWAAPQSANVVVHGKSLQLMPSRPLFVSGIGNVYAYFSTYRSNGTFLTDTYQGQTVMSGELRPRLGSNNLFEGSYAQSTEVVWLDRGTYAVTLPQNDSENDGVIDVLDVSKSGTFIATGSGFSAVDGSTFSIELNVTREAGSATGAYSAKTVSPNQTLTTTGDLNLLRYAGGFIYDRANNSLRMDVEISSPQYRRIIGDTSFTVNSDSRITYEPFTARDQSTGISYYVQQGQLNRLSGDVYVGDLRLSDGLLETYWADFTEYRVVVNDPFDHDNDGLPDLTDADAIPNPPSIGTQPSAPNTMARGQVVLLSVAAARADSFQWLYNGAPIAGATDDAYSVTVSPQTSGTYAVRVSNVFGSVTSAAVTVQESVPPTLLNDLRDLTAVVGQPVYLQVKATGPGLSYRWTRNRVPLLSETKDVLTLPSFAPNLSGSYRCEISNSFGLVKSRSISLGQSTGQLSKLANLSVRGYSGSGNDVLTGGFVSSGATKTFLMRSIGPTLEQFGVSGVMSDPRANLYDSNASILVSNNDWDNNILATASRLGAFALPGGSRDAGMMSALSPGVYTAQTIGAIDTDVGVVLFEIYDSDPAAPGELTNLSARARIDEGGSLVVGLVLQGDSSTTVLVRAVGPTLTNYGLDPIPDPKLEIQSIGAATTSVMSNTNWITSSNSDQLRATATGLGAFALDTSGGDSAILVTLAPGIYTATITSASGTGSGVALAEFYLLR